MSTVAYIGPTLSLEILGEPRGEWELLEMRILHERQHLVHSERWPVPNTNEISGLFHRQTHSHCARSFAPCSHMYSTMFAITCIHVRMADPVRTGFKPPREVDWLNAHSIRIGSMCIQCGRNQCAFDVQCGQAFRCGVVWSPFFIVRYFLTLAATVYYRAGNFPWDKFSSF